MFKWLLDFLSNRTFKVRIGRDPSESFGLDSGVPQGAILSPILFTILLSDPPNVPDVHRGMLANDEDNLEITTNRLQNAINIYSKWLKDIDQFFNPLKTTLMMFKRKNISNPPIIKP